MHHGIRTAAKEDIPALVDLWQTCFHDSEAYINLFYAHNFERMLTLVYECEGEVVSMLHLMQAAFVNGASRQDARLIYATGTLPAKRKKGYMSALLEYAKDLARQQGFGLFLKPSTDALTAFYQKCDFVPDAYFHCVSFEAGEPILIEFSPLSARDYNRLRDSAFAVYPYVKWEDAHIDWAIRENAFFGGETLTFAWQGNTYFLLGYPEGDTLVVNETNLPPAGLKQCSGSFCARFGTKKIFAYLPTFACEEGECMLSSVVYHNEINNTYVNLILI
ncbi:MAG: GNAT family N-acetyltransferase [Clostridia bacterium]|nr:GNAT family N-acetyltransferase [Clostridia bacterium]